MYATIKRGCLTLTKTVIKGPSAAELLGLCALTGKRGG